MPPPLRYVGSILGVPRLGIPGLHMQDAANGYRTLFPEQVRLHRRLIYKEHTNTHAEGTDPRGGA